MQKRKNGGAMYLYGLVLPIGAFQDRGYRHARGLGEKIVLLVHCSLILRYNSIYVLGASCHAFNRVINGVV